MDKLHTMADALMLYETIDAEQIEDIMEGRKPRPPKDWDSPKGGPGGSAVEDKPSAQGGGAIGGAAGSH
jgi:cell division protease FtsH